MGLVLNEDIAHRIFFAHWNEGFAVTEETRSGRGKVLVRRGVTYGAAA